MLHKFIMSSAIPHEITVRDPRGPCMFPNPHHLVHPFGKLIGAWERYFAVCSERGNVPEPAMHISKEIGPLCDALAEIELAFRAHLRGREMSEPEQYHYKMTEAEMEDIST